MLPESDHVPSSLPEFAVVLSVPDSVLADFVPPKRRCRAAKRPKAFLLENVKNLRSHDKGQTYRVIMQTLRDDLGYIVPEPRIIDAAAFVPPHHERVSLPAFRRTLP